MLTIRGEHISAEEWERRARGRLGYPEGHWTEPHESIRELVHVDSGTDLWVVQPLPGGGRLVSQLMPFGSDVELRMVKGPVQVDARISESVPGRSSCPASPGSICACGSAPVGERAQRRHDSIRELRRWIGHVSASMPGVSQELASALEDLLDTL